MYTLGMWLPVFDDVLLQSQFQKQCNTGEAFYVVHFIFFFIAKTVELAPSGYDVTSFPRQSLSPAYGVATKHKSSLVSNITFKIIFNFNRTSTEVDNLSLTF